MKHPYHPLLSRRDLLRHTGCGFGMMSFGALFSQQALAADNPLAIRRSHYPARAKRVIFLFMQGGPSHMDMFDRKPRLEKEAGKPLPFSLPKNYEAPGIRNTRLLGPVAGFSRQGKAGLEMTDMLPHIGAISSELCVLRGMHADSEAHAPAIRQLHTGHSIQVRPSMGSWVVYGLGTENQNLPGFVTVCPSLGGDGGTPQLFGSAFLPASFQGTPIGRQGDAKHAAVDYLKDDTQSTASQREQLDFLQSLNTAHLHNEADANLEAMSSSFELAFRMQMEAPQVLDTSRESQATLDLYGVGDKETDNFGR